MKNSETPTIEERVFRVVREQLGVDEVEREQSLADNLGADSLDVVELVMELEEEFDLNISDDDSEKVRTVGDAVDCISRLIGEESVAEKK